LGKTAEEQEISHINVKDEKRARKVGSVQGEKGPSTGRVEKGNRRYEEKAQVAGEGP